MYLILDIGKRDKRELVWKCKDFRKWGYKGEDQERIPQNLGNEMISEKVLGGKKEENFDRTRGPRLGERPGLDDEHGFREAPALLRMNCQNRCGGQCVY